MYVCIAKLKEFNWPLIEMIHLCMIQLILAEQLNSLDLVPDTYNNNYHYRVTGRMDAYSIYCTAGNVYEELTFVSVWIKKTQKKMKKLYYNS